MDMVDQAIEVLNRATKSDSKAVAAMMSTRYTCNVELADDPTIQVRCEKSANGEPDNYAVGALGIINGIFGINEKGWGSIAAIFESDGTLSGFRRTTAADWD